MNYRDLDDLTWREQRREPSPLRGLLLIGILVIVGYLVLALAGCSSIFATACEARGCHAPPADVTVPQATRLPGHLRDRKAQIATAVEVDVHCGLADWVGSGTLVTGDQVLTARHVAHCDWPGPVIRVKRLTGDPDAFPAHTEWESEDWDIARIKLAGGAHYDGIETPEIAPPPAPGEGDVCFVAVQPQGAVQCGARVSDDDPIDPQADIVHKATTIPGNSGSGVFDGAGRLVGVVTRFSDCTPGGWEHTFCGGKASSVANRDGVLP
jgi:hypothetical protein